MKNTYLFILAAILLVSACKKDEDQEPTPPNTCPTDSTYVKDISNYVGDAELLSTQEALDGSIHVEINDNGAWKAVQFSAKGIYTRTIDLGIYNSTKALVVRDAYYLSSYTESVNTVLDGVEYQGYKQKGYGGGCAREFTYDTMASGPTNYQATTIIRRKEFNGDDVWSQSIEGYYTNRRPVRSPLTFDIQGNLYAFTIDYEGLQYKLRINGNDYNLDDTSKPPFYLTDTILIKDDIHSFVTTKLNSNTGSIAFSKKNLLDIYYHHDFFNPLISSDAFIHNGIVLSNSIWFNGGNQLYKLDLNGNILQRKTLLNQGCFGENALAYLQPSINNSFFVITDRPHFLGAIFTRLDENGNSILEGLFENHAYYVCDFFPTNNGGYYISNIEVGGYNPGVNIQHNILEVIYNYSANYSCTDCNSTGTQTCSGDLVHAVDDRTTGNRLTWLVRTNEYNIL